MPVKSKAKRQPIKALPQQALTKKRKAGIFKYVKLKTLDFPTAEACIGYTITAERMRADKLYRWLDSRGYIWDARRRAWREKRR